MASRDLAAGFDGRSDHSVAVIGRLAAGAAMSDASVELQTIWTQLQAAYPDLNDLTPVMVPYSAVAGNGIGIADQGNAFLVILTVLSSLTLLIVCANVANLLIARATARHRELAVRLSLGASRIRIVRMLLAEGLIIASLATGAAFAVAWWVSRAATGFIAPGPWGAVGEMDFTPSWPVAIYALALAAIGVLVFTGAPAIRAWRVELLPWLKSDEQGFVQGRSRLSSSLVVLQLTLSVLLLTCAGLALRSLSLRGHFDPGFDARQLLLVAVDTSGSARTPDEHAAVLANLCERVRTVRGSYAGRLCPAAAIP